MISDFVSSHYAKLTDSDSPVAVPTCFGEGLVGMVTEDLCESASLGVDGLLHGLHPHPQIIVLSL